MYIIWGSLLWSIELPSHVGWLEFPFEALLFFSNIVFFFPLCSVALTSLILKSLDPICYVNCVSSTQAAAVALWTRNLKNSQINLVRTWDNKNVIWERKDLNKHWIFNEYKSKRHFLILAMKQRKRYSPRLWNYDFWPTVCRLVKA